MSVVTCHDDTQGPETWIHHLEFSAVQEADQVGNHTSIHNNLDHLLWTICQVGQGAADIGQDLCVGVLDKLSEYLVLGDILSPSTRSKSLQTSVDTGDSAMCLSPSTCSKCL